MQPAKKAVRASAATPERVCIMEALERHGGSLRSRHGIAARFMAIHGELGAVTNMADMLRTMQKQGMVALNEVPGNMAGKKITEVMLCSIPPNFVKPIAVLRTRKGIAFNPAMPVLDTEDDRTPTEVAEEVVITMRPPPATEGPVTPVTDAFWVHPEATIDTLRIKDLEDEVATLQAKLDVAITTIKALANMVGKE